MKVEKIQKMVVLREMFPIFFIRQQSTIHQKKNIHKKTLTMIPPLALLLLSTSSLCLTVSHRYPCRKSNNIILQRSRSSDLLMMYLVELLGVLN